MSTQDTHDELHTERRRRGWWVFIGFTAIAAFLFFSEHRAHLLGAVPWLLLGACPLMHFFMHGGHGHGDGSGQTGADRGADRS